MAGKTLVHFGVVFEGHPLDFDGYLVGVNTRARAEVVQALQAFLPGFDMSHQQVVPVAPRWEEQVHALALADKRLAVGGVPDHPPLVQLESRLEDITVPMDVSIIGCIVNGPGEAKESDFGLTGGTPANLVYIDGKPSNKIGNENLVDELVRQIRAKAAAKEAQLARDAENLIAKA